MTNRIDPAEVERVAQGCELAAARGVGIGNPAASLLRALLAERDEPCPACKQALHERSYRQEFWDDLPDHRPGCPNGEGK